MSDRTRRHIPRALPSTPNIKRFEARIEPGPNGCWNWIGAQAGTRKPYGHFTLAGRAGVYAHRWSYEYHIGPIPDGLEIDHLCRNRLCVNPWHLEPVTGEVNRQRYADTFTHCPHGHEYTPENTYTSRSGKQCRTCRARSIAAWNEKVRQERVPAPPKTHCERGHELTAQNVDISSDGRRRCSECRRRRCREWARRNRAKKLSA